MGDANKNVLNEPVYAMVSTQQLKEMDYIYLASLYCVVNKCVFVLREHAFRACKYMRICTNHAGITTHPLIYCL